MITQPASRPFGPPSEVITSEAWRPRHGQQQHIAMVDRIGEATVRGSDLLADVSSTFQIPGADEYLMSGRHHAADCQELGSH